MSNDVTISGWLGSDPQDFAETEDKQRFCRFDIAHNSAKEKFSNWITVGAYAETADLLVDQLRLQKGDKVEVCGFLTSQYGYSPSCRRRHRYTNVIANDCKLLEMSNERAEKHYRDVPQTGVEEDEDTDPIFGKLPIEEEGL